jgi:hypothetical protein
LTSGRAELARLRVLWDERPLLAVMSLAVLFRAAAALFAKGYGMHDDHFFVVELAQRWADGHWDVSDEMVAMRSLAYPWLHALLFRALQGAGVADPQAKMLVVRALHAAWSLPTVWFGYRIALRFSNQKTARLAGLLLAAFWILPFMSVRNLVEVVCQPLLVAGAWFLVRGSPRGGEETSGRDALAAGLLHGLAFAVRFQTLLVAGAAWVVLFALRRRRAALHFGLGVALAGGLVQGGSDWVGFGRPFASLIAYVRYNADPANVAGYPLGPWYQYLGLLAGVLIPPVSLLLLYGFGRGWRRWPLLFWPALTFLAFHSAYAGKQERFILPVLPSVLVLGVLGFEDLAGRSAFWQRHLRLLRGLWAWFWTVNGLLLLLLTTTYSKKTRVETLSYLHDRPDVRGVVIETSEPKPTQPPLFYLGRDVPVYQLPATKGLEALGAEIASSQRGRPNYLVLMGATNVEARVLRLAPLFPDLALERMVAPSLYDRLLHRLNPRHNVNLTAYVYRSSR